MRDFLSKLGLAVLLCLVQVMVLNHIHLGGYAVPLMTVYISTVFPKSYPKWAILLWCFVLGLAVDIFSNTAGVSAASLTLVGALQPYILSLFVTKEEEVAIVPSLSTLGAMKYCAYAFILILLFCMCFFTLETFSFFNWRQWLISIGASAALTFLLTITIESAVKR